MPRRVKRSDIEAELKAKEDAEKAAEVAKQREEERAAKEKTKAPVLKVAHKADEEAAQEKAAALASPATAPVPAPAPVEKTVPIPDTGKKTEKQNVEKQRKKAPAEIETASAKAETVHADAAAPKDQTEQTAPAAKHKQEGRPAVSEKPAQTGVPKKDDAKPVAPKSKDKKGAKKPAETAQAGAPGKRKPAKGRGGLVDDFKGPRKNPTIEDVSLEKQGRRRPSRRPEIHQLTPGEIADIERQKKLENLAPGTYVVTVPISVAGLASETERSPSDIIMALMKMGIMANINQNLDEETVELLAIELDIPLAVGKDEGKIVEEGIEDFEDDPADLVARPPIITVMGHVDHGKTSLLDAIRNTNVTDREAGGITQHIGASEVVTAGGEKIVFLDTPGHEAFTAMRARGAHVTDIAVLVVAADDGVMPQTVESISHAKAAGVPIIVAINKIDKPGANPDRVKQELSENGILVEEWGGDIIAVPVSAKTGDGIENLLEMILLQAEVLELRANPKRLALGTVIEARLDKSKGPLATLLVLNGRLTDKMSILAGTTSARVRTMTDFKGKLIRQAGPATAVEITGFAEVPQAGDEFHALGDDKLAKSIAESRKIRQREQVMAKTSGTSLENLFSKIKDGEVKELNLIIKADVMGSVGAIATSLEKIDVEGVRVAIIHRGVGAITESDVMLASTSGAIVIGFNVRPASNVASLAEREAVEIRTYRVIYDVINDIESALKGMLDPEFKEVVLGKAQVRETFRLPSGNQIAGAYVTEGKILRNAEIRLVRDGIVIHEGKIGSLRRFKDDVREVDKGYECGIGIENYNDIKENDEIEAFKMEEIPRD
jgi:translation initiation factor IF-2